MRPCTHVQSASPHVYEGPRPMRGPVGGDNPTPRLQPLPAHGQLVQHSLCVSLHSQPRALGAAFLSFHPGALLSADTGTQHPHKSSSPTRDSNEGALAGLAQWEERRPVD